MVLPVHNRHGSLNAAPPLSRETAGCTGSRLRNEPLSEETAQTPTYLLARNLPQRPHDAPVLTRTLLEQDIATRTKDVITIENHLDETLIPESVNYYTNDVWHGEGIPAPTREGLAFCDCKGSCRNNKRCACRQHQYDRTGLDNFGYNPHGQLLQEARTYSLWECNEMCQCDFSCINRASFIALGPVISSDFFSLKVVQNGCKFSLKIAKSEKKGWGEFSSRPHMPH